MIEWLKKVVEDSDGAPSSMRVVFVFLGLTFSLAFVVCWMWVSLYNRVLAEIPSGVYDVLGILLVGKSLQRGIEVYGETKKTPE